MNKHGTYRIVKYADDGQYDIHWTCCDSHMRSCKWQAERFSFCPFCGAGHATKLECRESSTARWAYDLHSDDEHKAASVSYDADVKAHNLKKNQTRWIIEREGRRNTGSWFATHRVHYLHASDALKAADSYSPKKGRGAERATSTIQSSWFRLVLVTKTSTTQRRFSNRLAGFTTLLATTRKNTDSAAKMLETGC